MAELISQERFEIWDQFIERWPIEKLWAITVLSIVNAAVEGNLSVIDAADLGHTTK